MHLEAKDAKDLAGSHQELEEAGRTFPWTLRGSTAPPTPGFQTLVPRTVRSDFCCVSTPSEVMALCRHPPRPRCWAGPQNRRQSPSRLDPTRGVPPGRIGPPPESSSVCRSPSSDIFSGIIVSRIPRDFFELASRPSQPSPNPTLTSDAINTRLDSVSGGESGSRGRGGQEQADESRSLQWSGQEPTSSESGDGVARVTGPRSHTSRARRPQGQGWVPGLVQVASKWPGQLAVAGGEGCVAGRLEAIRAGAVALC